jgi:hypothetical protein
MNVQVSLERLLHGRRELLRFRRAAIGHRGTAPGAAVSSCVLSAETMPTCSGASADERGRLSSIQFVPLRHVRLFGGNGLRLLGAFRGLDRHDEMACR